VFKLGFLALLLFAADPQAGSAQGDRKGTPGIDSAVRSGQFEQAAAILRRAAEGGNAEAQYELASLYRSGRGVPQDDEQSFRWMKAAAEKGHQKAQFNLGRMLLTGRGAPLDIGQARFWLQKAAAQGHEDAVKLLAQIPSNADSPPPGRSEVKAAKPLNDDQTRAAAQRNLEEAARNGRPAILDAAWRGQADAVRKLAANGPDKARDEDGNTALSLAAAAGKLAVIDVLLSLRADINASNRSGERPLMLAAAKGHADVVARLLARGADVSTTSASGETALTLALRGCHEDAALRLINGRAAVDLALDRGVTPLMLAAAECSDTVVASLLDQGAKINAADASGRTALWLAANRGRADRRQGWNDSAPSRSRERSRRCSGRSAGSRRGYNATHAGR
jgi:ankyrin repeat protein